MTTNRLMTAVLGAALLVCASNRPAVAQEREGFSFGVGAGAGGADVTCDECAGSLGDDVEYGPAFYARLGYALNKHVVGGLELNVWGKKWDGLFGTDVTTGLGSLTGTVQVYPSATAGFYLKGGLGISRAAVKVEGAGFDETDASDIGFGYQVGLGWDIPLGSIALTPEVAAWYGKINEFEGLAGWKHGVVQATLGITFP